MDVYASKDGWFFNTEYDQIAGSLESQIGQPNLDMHTNPQSEASSDKGLSTLETYRFTRRQA